MTVHTLKIWPENFVEIAFGHKTCEIRHTKDRDYRVGDILKLMEWDKETKQYTGQEVSRKVTHIDRIEGTNLVALSLNDPNEDL